MCQCLVLEMALYYYGMFVLHAAHAVPSSHIAFTLIGSKNVFSPIPRLLVFTKGVLSVLCWPLCIVFGM